MRFNKNFLPIFFVTLLWQYSVAQGQPIENAVFWKISGRGITTPSYLFGTYHVLNSGYLVAVPNVKKAYEKASGVVVETELDSSKMLQTLFMVAMKDKLISDMVAPKDYALISQELANTSGMSMDMLNSFKPSFVTLLLTMSYNQQVNKELLAKYGGHPIDGYIASNARKQNKPVTTFETMKEQIDMLFNHEPVEEQAKQLVEFVKAKKEMLKAQKDITQLYLEQDLVGMQKLFNKYSKQFGDATYLLDDRNVKWMKKFPAMFIKGDQFIAVGAMHFVGEHGLIKLLRADGYTVTPVALK